MAGPIIGVDLGGTKILTALVDEGGRVLGRARIPTPASGPDTDIEAIVQSVRTVVARSGVDLRAVAGMGVGAPGPLDPATGVVFEPPNLPGWKDVPLAERLADRLGLRIYVENDANAAALGERWVGAGAGVDDLVYITVSTGVGGGLIVRGQLYHGVSGTAGEVGHMVIDPRGPRCHCGRTGCLEQLASGTAIAREARAALAAGRPSVLAHLPAGELSAEDVARAARDGDPLAREVFAHAAAALGTGVANLVNLLNPAMVVIGGGVARAGDLLLAPVRRIVQEEAFDRPAAAVRIVPAALGDDVGAVGAAAVVRERQAVQPAK
ncbi:MAG: ROK family protein [Armatimonadota bacterium]|nr:ROK family protein [Armatimonadota bacterium]MDR7518294.1 ROK family protein [Armatimonadota bacterium]MDR7549944.1 ROK family protein [Armatimonadota bacterium]